MSRFFGYGSLVNANTHDYDQIQPATLSGWRRQWCLTNFRPVAFLSVEPCPKSSIQGLSAAVPDGDWRALDQRERAYRRHDISHQLGPQVAPTQIYQVDPAHLVPARMQTILLSYLDVVVQGFLQVFGQQGVQQFFDTTGGWSGVLLDDRAAPLYPRHQRLSARETALVDDHIARLPMPVKQLE